MMNLDDFRALLAPAGQEALRAAEMLEPREEDFLRDFTALRRQFAPDIARLALETAILRRKAAVKFPFAERLYFTREALEQATPYAVSSYRARRFAGLDLLIDAGCSTGGDTISLRRLAPTLGLDLDPLRLRMAQANLSALGLGERAHFLQADLAASLPLRPPPLTGLFFDPARRAQGRRAFSIRDYHPPLEVIRSWLERIPALGVKVSPGVDLAELAGYAAEVEFISLNGELKEAALWFGPLRSAERRATLLPGEHTLASGGGAAEALPLSEPLAYLYEPDAAVLRAGLVADLGLRLGASQLDPDIAYLTAAGRQETPFARAWEVEAWFPFQLKRLRAELRSRGVGRVVVKKRGSPIQPEALIRDLRLAGGPDSPERVVCLTHLKGRPIAILCLPEPTPDR